MSGGQIISLGSEQLEATNRWAAHDGWNYPRVSRLNGIRVPLREAMMLNPDRPLARFQDALRCISADCDRGTYLKVLMALHHEGRGSDGAREMAEQWARQGEKYAAHDFAKDWRSLGPRPNAVTGGTIMALAATGGYRLGRAPGREHAART